jgi:DNA-binding transcriptional LysR family regulator
VRVRGRLASDTAAVAHLWARQGRGVVYQSELDLGDSIARGELVPLFVEHVGAEAPLYAVLPSKRFVPQRVKVLVDELAALFSRRLEQPR